MFHFHCLSSPSFDIRIRAKFGVMKEDLYEILLKEKIPRFSLFIISFSDVILISTTGIVYENR